MNVEIWYNKEFKMMVGFYLCYQLNRDGMSGGWRVKKLATEPKTI